MKCPECDSENTISHTDSELRADHLLLWQCYDCENEWLTGWDVNDD